VACYDPRYEGRERPKRNGEPQPHLPPVRDIPFRGTSLDTA